MLTVQLTQAQADRLVEIIDGERECFQDHLDDAVLDKDITPNEIAGQKAEIADLTAMIQVLLDAGAEFPH